MKDLRNWPKIAELEDDEIRWFFMTVTNTELISGLARGFPDLFHAEPQEFGYTTEEVKQAAYEIQKKAWPDEPERDLRKMARCMWDGACSQLGIPCRWVGVGLEIEQQLVRFEGWSDAVGVRIIVLGFEVVLVGAVDDYNLICVASSNHITPGEKESQGALR